MIGVPFLPQSQGVCALLSGIIGLTKGGFIL